MIVAVGDTSCQVPAGLSAGIDDDSGVRVGVVLAAGRSERLSQVTSGHSKALLRVGGVPLIERAIRTLRSAGIGRVIVVLGYQADALEAHLAGADVETVRADGWENGNGASMAAAEGLVGDDSLFALMCGDHLFADGALDELARSTAPAVLVDPSPDSAVWAEGTKVHIHDGVVTEFHKTLPDAAVDCGVFVLPRSVFAVAKEVAARGDHSLAGAVTALGQGNPIRAVPIRPESWWQDVDTPEDLRTARTVVRRSLGKASDGAVSRHLNRPISTRITMALAPLRLSPNLLSLLTALVGLWAGWSLAAGHGLVGGALVQAASVLDGSDGETARMRGTASRRGAKIDEFLDRMVDAAIFAGLSLWALGAAPEWRVAVIGVAALGFGGVATSLSGPLSSFELPKGDEPRLSALVGGRDARMLILAVGSAAGLPLVALLAAVATYAGTAGWRVFLVLSGRRAPAATGGSEASRRLGTGLATPWAVVRDAARGKLGHDAPTRDAGLARVVRALLFPAVIVAAFAIALPRIVDLHAVWALIRALSWQADVLLALLAAVNLVTYWPLLMVAMPGLSLRQAAIVCQSSTLVAMTVPAGGALAVGVSYAMYSSWGFRSPAIATSTLATFVASMSVKFLLPAIALALFVIEGGGASGLTAASVTGGLALAILVVSFAILLRTDGAARLVGRAAENAANLYRSWSGRSPISGLEDRAAAFRERLNALLRERWHLLSITAIASQLSVLAVMLAAMKVVGITEDEVTWVAAAAVFASVRLASSVPIVPGNVGIAELGYIGGLVLAGGETTEVVAAVLLFRFLTYFVQVPIGGVTFLFWRRQHA